MKRVFVVEDQTILRDLICRLLESYPDIEVLGALGDGQRALEEIVHKQPDIVILDIMLPNLNGVEVLRALKNNDHKPKILIFSAFPSKNMVKKYWKLALKASLRKMRASLNSK